MAATIYRLRTRPERLRRDEGARIREALIDVQEGAEPMVSAAIDRLLSVLDRLSASSNRWTFLMLSPDQNAIVVDYLASHSKRPVVAMRLWALLFKHLRTDTGEVTLSREEIAAKLGVPVQNVSSLMSELVKFGAISRKREVVAGLRGPGLVRYFMNPNVATHLAGKARDDAQREVPPVLQLVGGTVHPAQRKPDGAA